MEKWLELKTKVKELIKKDKKVDRDKDYMLLKEW